MEQRQKSKDEWFVWDGLFYDWGMESYVYFASDDRLDDCLEVHFYMEREREPDPLSYLHSMICASVGRKYEGLELLDYQFILLAIIHDAQSWSAGRVRIYFDPEEGKGLSDRLCRAAWQSLKNMQVPTYLFNKDTRRIINTALRAVKANLEREKLQSDLGTGTIKAKETKVEKPIKKKK